MMLSEFQKLMCPKDGVDLPPRADQVATSGVASIKDEPEVVSAFRRAHVHLVDELLDRIHGQSPLFFEELVIDVLLAAGYGARRRDLTRRLGQTGDGGIDGVIALDELGLDLIYIQAKRLKPGTVVAVSEVRDFVGSLDANRASKGTFVSTSHFSPAAVAFCRQASRRVVLIDGQRFAELMIRFNVGVSVVESYQIKRIDPDYFAGAGRNRTMISASSQPRR